MEKKRVFSKSLILLAITSIMLFAMSITSMAATETNIIIHHMNPIAPEDIINRNDDLLNPEYLISTVLNTHNAIHYGDSNLLPHALVERRKNDMCPWRH